MVKFIRKFRQPFMIVFTMVSIVTLAGFYSHTDFLDRGHGSRMAEIYGRGVTVQQAQRLARKGDLSQQIGMTDLFRSLGSEPTRDPRQNFIWNNLVLKHEAEQLGVEPTEDEIVEATKAMPVFQQNGAYDPMRYTMITQIALSPRGFTTEDLSDLIGDDLRMKKIQTLLGSTVPPAESEIHAAFVDYTQKTEASVVRFHFADFLSSAQVPDEDVKKLFEERKASLKTDESRKVKFVAFTLPPPEKPTDKPLQGKPRAEALMKLQKQAEDFAVAMADKNAKFDEVASKSGAKVQESSEFLATAAPEELGGSHEAVAVAFKLTEQDPNSDVIESPKGYYVLQLAHITPQRPLTFDEAKANLVDTLKHERATEAISLKAADVRNKIDAAMKGGKSFVEAAQAVGVKAEEFPVFSMKERKSDTPDAEEIMQAASGMKEGQLSNAMPTADGGNILVYVAKRLPVDEKDYQAEKPKFTEMLRNYQQMELFQEWLKLRRAAAQLKTDVHS